MSSTLLADAIPMLALLLAIGALAGVLAGLLGVGGGIVLVPAFLYTFSYLGYESPHLMQVSIATSLATIVVTSIRSVSSHHRRGTVAWDILRTWAPGIAMGAVLGVGVTSVLNSNALQAVFGWLALSVGVFMLLSRPHWRLGHEMPGRAMRLVLSPLVGFLSTLMGIGGGAFGVPLLTLFGRPIHHAVATTAGFGVLIAVPSVVVFLLLPVPSDGLPPLTIGAVNLIAFSVVIATTLLTTPIGVRLAHALNPAPLKRVFAAFIVIVALNMIRKSMGW